MSGILLSTVKRRLHLFLPNDTKLKNVCEKTHSAKVCRLAAPAAGEVREFPLQCSGKSMALFSGTWAGEESYSYDLKQKVKFHNHVTFSFFF